MRFYVSWKTRANISYLQNNRANISWYLKSQAKFPWLPISYLMSRIDSQFLTLCRALTLNFLCFVGYWIPISNVLSRIDSHLLCAVVYWLPISCALSRVVLLCSWISRSAMATWFRRMTWSVPSRAWPWFAGQRCFPTSSVAFRRLSCKPLALQ